MSYETYRVLHLSGLILVFLGLGGVLLQPRKAEALPNHMAIMLHGIGLIILLGAGVGAVVAKPIEWPWPGWLYAKLGLWLLLGAMPALHKRGIVPTPLTWLVAAATGAAAVWLAIAQPF